MTSAVLKAHQQVNVSLNWTVFNYSNNIIIPNAQVKVFEKQLMLSVLINSPSFSQKWMLLLN